MKNYSIAKNMFLEGCSLRKIGSSLGINRKKLSLMLRKDGFHTDKKISEPTLVKAIEMIKTGKKITHVANDLSVDRHTLSKNLNDLSIRTPQKYNRKITEHDSDILFMYKKDKLSIEAISKLLNISTNAVWNCLIANDSIDSNRTSSIYKYNTNLFKSISTELEAYWLGFLYADGYVNTYGTSVELCLQKRDEDHVKKFMHFVSLNKRNSYDKDVNGHIQHRIDIHSKDLVQNIIKCGCVNNKTFVLEFPTSDIVPNELMHHFVRGYFDADGCLFSGKAKTFSITSASNNFIIDLQNYLVSETGINKTKIAIKEPKKDTHNFLYTMRNSKRNDILNLYKFLYKDASIYLERKHKKFIYE